MSTATLARRSARIHFVHASPLVLIADDHDDSRDIARIVLENAHFRVAEARTGPEAVAVVQRERPNVVLLDIVMPELNGWDVARKIRTDPANHSTVIIAMTALAGSNERENSLAAGCDDQLTKPVHPRILLDTLRRWIDDPPTGQAFG